MKTEKEDSAPKKDVKEVTEDVKKGFSTFFGKISGKEQLELEIDRLNSYIVGLELDRRSVMNQLEKKEALTKQAVADKQEAEARLNQELVRVQTLTHEVETLRAEVPEKFKFRGTETLSPSAVRAYLSKLNSFRAPAGDLLTVYLPYGIRLSDVLNEKLLSLIEEETRTLLDRLDPETGLVLFHDLHRMISEAVVPPVPVTGSAWHLQDSFETAPLEESLDADYRMLVLIIHAGESFIGFASDARVFDEEELVKSSVKEKHSKGGFSQRRFERLREEDIAHHLDKVMEAVNKVLEENSSIDCIIMSGDTQLIKEVEKRLPLNLEVIVKPTDLKVEKISGEDVLRSVLSCRRYLL
ncbi:peptide chain release factor-like protein [Methanosarcina sp. KYL-1]|nr:peptide chain release factor-like protein [Methanosarcina sp. KYL-1]